MFLLNTNCFFYSQYSVFNVGRNLLHHVYFSLLLNGLVFHYFVVESISTSYIPSLIYGSTIELFSAISTVCQPTVSFMIRGRSSQRKKRSLCYLVSFVYLSIKFINISLVIQFVITIFQLNTVQSTEIKSRCLKHAKLTLY